MINNKLSKYPSGSVREILAIGIPLMIASFSFHFMLTIDRAILAKHSVIDFNAAAVISMIAIVFQFMVINITAIAEVLAGQYYGSKQYKMVARPVWQMIFFALFMAVPFFIIGKYLGWLFVPEQYGKEGEEYFELLMVISILPAIGSALGSFFIARGKTLVITISAVISNIVNIIIAFPLILGWEGYLEPLGLMGSVYASLIAFLLQLAIMFAFFFSKKNRQEFDVLNTALDFSIIKRCLRIGVPNSIGHGAEIMAYAATLRYLATVSEDHITVAAIAQNFFILVVFFTEGMQKSMIAIASNAIGSKNLDIIAVALKSAVRIIVIFTFIAAVPLAVFPEASVKLFFSEINDNVFKLATIALIGSLLFFFVDVMAWGTYSAILTAGGDTRFLMMVNIFTSWMINFMTTYTFIDKDTSPVIPWLIIMPAYATCNFIAFKLRYHYGKWRQNLTKD